MDKDLDLINKSNHIIGVFKSGNMLNSLEEIMQVKNVSDYDPLFTTMKNYNGENNVLNTTSRLLKIVEKKSDNVYLVHVENDGKSETKEIFVKFCPLINPLWYLTGKYSNEEKEQVIKLPKMNDNLDSETMKKKNDSNNSAYIDNMFSYLTSKLHKKGFVHGLEYYGGYIGYKENFKTNVGEDLSYIYDSEYFLKNISKEFDIDNTDYKKNLNMSSKYREKIVIKSLKERNAISLKSLKEIDFEDVFKSNTNNVNINELQEVKNIEPEPEGEVMELKSCSSSNTLNTLNTISSCNSSLVSYTTDEDEGDEEEDEEDEEEEEEEDEESEESEEENVYVTIPTFPVKIVCMEKCKDTLDNYIDNFDESEINTKNFINKWKSFMMQIIMTLLTYEKVFNFTHNDLHTNNIMYVETEQQYLYYEHNKVTYKVPTYGKIFKIIDFGRAIYDYKGVNYCSDAFKKGEDASTQYNFGVYVNEEKKIVEPNYSFDLCRLGCSVFDFIVNDLEEINDLKKNKILKILLEWCEDDKGKNILYKSSGEERYPDFKLYKMIARTVHNHTPENQLKRELFKSYIIKNVPSDVKVMKIDEY